MNANFRYNLKIADTQMVRVFSKWKIQIFTITESIYFTIKILLQLIPFLKRIFFVYGSRKVFASMIALVRELASRKQKSCSQAFAKGLLSNEKKEEKREKVNMVSGLA